VGRFTADAVEGNLTTKESDLTNAEFRLKVNGANGQAQKATLENNNITMEKLTFSTCPAGDESWRLKAGALDIDNIAGWGEAEDVTLEVAGVPVFYFPWLKFPTDDRRHTGLLPPTFGNTERNGFDVSAPIYINLAPNYDLTLTPRHLAKRGTQLGSEFRYLFTEHRGQFEIEYLQDQEVPSNEDDQRWSYRVRHLSSWEPGWLASIQAAGVSDDNYFTDLGSGLGLANFDQLKRSAEIGYHTTTFSAALSWLQFQPLSLTNEPYRQTPQLTAAWQDQTKNNQWSWQLGSSYTDFSNQDNSQLSAQRWSTQASVSRNFSTPGAYLKPKVKLFHNQYKQFDNVNSASENIAVTVPQFSLDSGLVFEKKLDHGTQTLEPRLFLLYSKAEQQDEIGLYDTYEPILTFDRLWLHNRFSGHDRIADAQQASLGLTSRIFNENNNEVFNFGIGRAYYFDDRVVGLTPQSETLTKRQSDVISQIAWSPINQLTLLGQHNFDTKKKETSAGRLSLVYEPKRDFVVNVSHRFVDNEFGYREQSDIGFAVPLSDQWRVMSRWQYDLPNKRSLETMAGIEYQSCCWSIRLVTKRYLNARLDPNGAIIPDPNGRFNSDIQLQVVFRGLGSDSKPFSQLVNDSQWGY
ncbi:MAG: LPS assembly protein LptD, partial [Gammaproteobacteria bacterium]|nr:LPS assembly protein LptD [Gammaproteobacteria bacterium]